MGEGRWTRWYGGGGGRKSCGNLWRGLRAWERGCFLLSDENDSLRSTQGQQKTQTGRVSKLVLVRSLEPRLQVLVARDLHPRRRPLPHHPLQVVYKTQPATISKQ